MAGGGAGGGGVTGRKCSVLSIVGSRCNIVLAEGNYISMTFHVCGPRYCDLRHASLRRHGTHLCRTFGRLPSNDFIRGRSIFLGERCIRRLRKSDFVSGTRRERFSNHRCLRRSYLLVFALSNLSSLTTSCGTGPFSCQRELRISSQRGLARFLRKIGSTVNIVGDVESAHLREVTTTDLERCIVQCVGFFPQTSYSHSVRFSKRVAISQRGTHYCAIYSNSCLPSHAIEDSIRSAALPISKYDLCVTRLRNLNIRLRYGRTIGRVLCFRNSRGLCRRFSHHITICHAGGK